MVKAYKINDTAIIFEENRTILFAVEELARYAKEGGAKIEFAKVKLGSSESFFIENGIDSAKLRFDGYVIKAKGEELIIASNLPRGVLFGVYTLLEENGCRFVKAGVEREKIFFQDGKIKYFQEKVYNPDFEIRSLSNCANFIDETVSKEIIDIVDWCAKNRMNNFFLHQSIDSALNDYNYKLCDEIEKRGMIYEFGGHGAQNFVSRDLFSERPDYFIEKNGARVKEGNFCISSDKAVEMYLSGVKKLLKNNPQIKVLHLWFDDVLGGSWCACGKCKDMQPIEQMNRLIDLAASALKEDYPELKVDMLLYHDTIINVKDIRRNSSNVLGFWAPRERCYAHGISEKECKLNDNYCRLLSSAIETFGANNLSVFEYYTDFILFSKVKNNLSKVISSDLKFYLSKGINKITTLGFGFYSFWAYDLNSYVYAKHMFNVNLDVEKTVYEFICDIGQDNKIIEYYELLEQFTKLYFSFCGYSFEFCDIRRVPLSDYLGKHIKNVKRAKKVLNLAREKLNEISYIKNSNFIEYEKKLLDLSILDVSGILVRMQLRYENFVGKKVDDVLDRIDIAKKCLIEEIEKINEIPIDVKGYNGLDVFIKNLCRTQIWTANELLVQEFGMDIDLDMTKILEGNYDIRS